MRSLFLFISVLLLYGISLFAIIERTEIENLYNEGKYSILLEKTVNILSSGINSLSKTDKEFLFYYTGISYIKDGNIDIGITYFEKLEKNFPDSLYLKKSYSQLISLYKKKTKEIYYIQKLTDKFPKTREAFEASIILGKMYLKKRKFNFAINVFEQLINEWKMGNINPEVYILLTLSYAGTDAYLDALYYLRIAKKTIPKLLRIRANYLFETSKVYFYTQNYKDSARGFQRFINVFPNDKRFNDALIFLSNSLIGEKRYYDSAIISIEKLYKNTSLINYNSLENKKKYYSLLLNLTKSLIKLSEKERKIFKRKYKNFTNIDKNLMDIKNNSLDYKQRRAATILLNDKFLKNGDMAGAIENYFRFLKKKGDPYIRKKYREYLTEYIKQLKDNESIGQILRLWVLIKPRKSFLSGENLAVIAKHLVDENLLKNSADIYNHILKYTLYKKFWDTALRQLLKIKFKLGEYDKFLNIYKKIKLPDDNIKYEFLYYNLIALQRTNRDKEGQELLKNVKINRIFDIYRYKIEQIKGDYLVKLNRYDEALNIYLKLRNTVFYKRLGSDTRIADTYFLKDDLENAMKEYLKLEKSGNKSEWILFQKINIYKKQNMEMEAEKETEKLKTLNPNSFWVKQLEKNV